METIGGDLREMQRTPGMSAQTLANNTMEQNQKQQPSKDQVKKAWYHFWW